MMETVVLLGSETVAAKFADANHELYCIIIVCCSVTNDPSWHSGGQGSLSGVCLVCSTLVQDVDVPASVETMPLTL